MDGFVDIWDYYYRQNAVAYTHKVGDHPLSSIAVQGTTQGGGRLVAVGDVNGTVSLLEVCDGLATMQSNEKAAIQGTTISLPMHSSTQELDSPNPCLTFSCSSPLLNLCRHV